MSLLQRWDALWDNCRAGFAQNRTWERARRLALSHLVCLGRHTVTGALCASGRQFSDWSADYRLFSQARWHPDELFGAARQAWLSLLPPVQDVVTALDDSYWRKTGTHIPHVKFVRDPMSPPFRPNFIRGQRFCQLSGLLPDTSGSAPARGIPLQFQLVPPVAKPDKNAAPEAWTDYRRRTRQEGVAAKGARLLHQFRQQLDADGATKRTLICAIDGGYTNSTMLRACPERTILIGRIRSDARLHHLPEHYSGRGRKRSYGERAPTPEQLRQDDRVPWQSVSAFAAGRVHRFQIKTISPLLWRKAGPAQPLRLVVIRPLGYRPRKGARLLYRQPAYLICTDPALPLQQLVQDYVWRWEIELNHRDEKQLIGVGQAQVRHPESVHRVPALAVAAYAFLLLAAPRTTSSPPSTFFPLPHWRRRLNKPRLSTQDLINRLRHELWGVALSLDLPNFDDFAHTSPRHTKSQKFETSLGSAMLYAVS